MAEQNLSTEWNSNMADPDPNPDATTVEPAPDDTSKDLVAGRNTDVMISKPNDTVSTRASANHDSTTDGLAEFDHFYGKKIARSTHLYIASPDGKSTLEIAALDGMSTGFSLKIKLVFGREQSCVMLEARFERENCSMSSRYQKIFVKFYVNSVEDLDYWQYTNVSDVDHIPLGLAMFPKAVKYFKRYELWVLDLEYVNTNIVTEGLNDYLDFVDPTKIHAIKILR